MGSKLRIGVLLIGCSGVLAATLGAASVAAKAPAKKLRINCTVTAYNLDYPKLSGSSLGQEQCSKPFGSGVQAGRTTTTITGSAVKVSGTFKNFFDDGTNSGKVKMAGTVGSGPLTVKGTVTVTRGTGAYKHMKGTGKVTCTTSNAGKTFRCSVKGKATR
jgi:hypothetical protein